MRTITAAQQAVLNAGVQGEHYRVSIKDDLNLWRDLTSYGGFNAVDEFTLSENIEDPHRTLDVRLKRELYKMSFAPGISSSPINRAFNPSTLMPLIRLNREVKLEVAITPMDHQPAAAADWMEIFRGKIDDFDPAKGYGLNFGCRASPTGRLAQQWIKTERVYSYAADGTPAKAVACRIWDTQIQVTAGEYLVPASRGASDPGFNKFLKCSQSGTTGLTEPSWTTGVNQVDGTAKWDYVGAPTTAGNPLEQILQNILDDARGIGDSQVLLWTPTSPGWSIRQFLQESQFTLDATRALAQQIGWDLRSKWHEVAGQYEFTLYQPDRGTETVSPTVLYTFAPSDYGEVEELGVDIAKIRNNLRIVWPDRSDLWPDGTPKRKVSEYKNQASIDKYGDLFSKIQEEENSQIDSQTEVDKLGNSFISDCCEPNAQMSVTLKRGFPWVEVNDFYRFTANNLQFDTDMKLAVTSWSLSRSDGKTTHKLNLRGLPTIGATVWIAKTEHPDHPPKAMGHRLSNFQGTATPGVSFLDTVGGTRAVLTVSLDKNALAEEYEHHIYQAPGTTLDSSTLKTISKDRNIEFTDLLPGGPYYHRVVPRTRNAGRVVRGQPSKEQSFVAGRASSGHLKGGIALGDYPLNGGFETRADAAGMPDHWVIEPTFGTFGTNVQVMEDANGISGGRYLRLIGNTSRGVIVDSALVPVINEAGEANRTSQLYRLTLWTKAANANTEGFLEAMMTLYDYSGAIITASATVLIDCTAKKTHWVAQEIYLRVDATTAVRSALLTLNANQSVSSNYTIDVDEVRITRVGTDWYNVGATTKFTDNYESVPAFGGTWANFGAPYAVVAFRRDQFGRVWLKGIAKSGVIGGTIFTLPLGYRPASEYVYVPCISNNAFGVIEIQGATGNVVCQVGNAASVSLDGISFLTR